jgi:hypothetical protein
MSREASRWSLIVLRPSAACWSIKTVSAAIVTSRRIELHPAPRVPFLRGACTDFEVPEHFDSAALVATELVTNALVQTESGSQLRVALDRRGLWIEVRDFRRGDARPRSRAVGGRDSGRGLHMVPAVAQQRGN